MARQLLARGDTVVGTVPNIAKVEKLTKQCPDTLDCRLLDVTDVLAVHASVDAAFSTHDRIDAVVCNAGYGLSSSRRSCPALPHLMA